VIDPVTVTPDPRHRNVPAGTVNGPAIVPVGDDVHDAVIEGVALPELFAGFGSAVDAVTLAVFATAVCGARTTIIADALPPDGMSVSAHVTIWPAAEHPGDPPWNTSPAGNGSTTFTPTAVSGPALWTINVYVSCCPAITGIGDAVFVSDRSAAGTTSTEADDELLPGTVSAVADDTDA
jgi:hypothetical protein